MPKSAVRATGQGVVFEDGGRPATARASATCHFYPFYIGAALPGWLKLPETGCPQVTIACVTPDGRRLGESKTLIAKIERIDTVHAYRETSNGWHTWDTERVRAIVVENVEVTTSQDHDTVFSLPLREGGEYVLTVTDPVSQSSFAITAPLAVETMPPAMRHKARAAIHPAPSSRPEDGDETDCTAAPDVESLLPATAPVVICEARFPTATGEVLGKTPCTAPAVFDGIMEG